MMTELQLLERVLRETQERVERQASQLKGSYSEFESGAIETSDDRLRDEEALTVRFSRLSDILVRRFYRVVAEIDDAPASEVVDVLHHAEKVGLLTSTERMRELRVLRNRIAHEYEEPGEHNTIARVLGLTPFLLECADRAVGYTARE